MCLILEIKPDGQPLSVDEYVDVAKKNPDGFTVIRASDGALLYRGLDPVAAWEALQQSPVDVVIHWRRRTSGPVDVARCHGWRVGSVRFLHNGVISSRMPIDDGHSDTTTLVRRMASMGLDPLSESGRWFLRCFSENQTFVLVGQTGGTTWIGNTPFEHRGRLYSNRYAWTDEVHGIERPKVINGFHGGWGGFYDSDDSDDKPRKGKRRGVRVWKPGDQWDDATPPMGVPVQGTLSPLVAPLPDCRTEGERNVAIGETEQYAAQLSHPPEDDEERRYIAWLASMRASGRMG